MTVYVWYSAKQARLQTRLRAFGRDSRDLGFSRQFNARRGGEPGRGYLIGADGNGSLMCYTCISRSEDDRPNFKDTKLVAKLEEDPVLFVTKDGMLTPKARSFCEQNHIPQTPSALDIATVKARVENRHKRMVAAIRRNTGREIGA